MKKEYYLRGVLGVLVMALLITGCSKDEGATQTEFESLTFDSEAVLAMIPDGLKNATDPYAQICESSITTSIDMSSFITLMEVPPDAQRSAKKSSSGGGDTWQWNWNYAGQNATFYYTFEEDNSKNYWTLDIQYGGGPVFKYIDAWEFKDGSGGEVLYNFNWAFVFSGGTGEDYAELHWKYVWNKSSSGDYTIDWLWESDSEDYEYLSNYKVKINADGSGSLDTHAQDEFIYDMEWDATGAGSWIYYQGEIETSGTWTAG